MTILPKKKVEEESDSDGDNSADDDEGPHHHHDSSPHGASGHSPLGSPNAPEEVGYHSPDGFYHRRYDLSSSSGESSPELPSLSKRLSYRSPPSATASGLQGKKPLDSSPGYNSSEEYDGSQRPYINPEDERQFENALRKERGLIIKKMRPDGACLFRAIADQVYGDQEMNAVVRNNCMDYMLKNADYFSQYISDEDFEHYINRKRQDQCYGNNIEMQAMAEMYNRPIEVYQYTTDPINIFFGVYKTDNAPLRLSYHGSIHYNSVVDPYKATVGVGLGLAGHKPGFADKMLLVEAQRDSENVHIEQTMLEDKKRSTDWEATYDAIEEAVARESYLTWIRENEKRALPQPGKQAGSQPSSSACRANSPPTSCQIEGSPITGSAASRKFSAKSVETKHAKPPRSLVLAAETPPLSNSAYHHHHRGGLRRFTPSPPSGHHHNHHHHHHQHHHHHRGGSGSGVGSGGGGTSMLRNAPYYSPRDSPRGAGSNCGGGGGGVVGGGGALRGSARNSPPKESFPRMHGCGGSPGGVSRSPSPRTSPLNDAARFSLAPPPQNAGHAYSESSSAEASPHHSPASLRKPCSANFNEGGKPKSPTLGSASVPLERTLSPYQAIPPPLPPPQSMPGHAPSSSPPPAGGNGVLPPPQAPTSSPEPAPSGSQSPPHTLDFEDGRVLSQLPYEYSSFLDLPPSALGLSEWEDDRLLAAVLAASQQEYIDSLRCPRTSQGAEGNQ